MAVFVLFIFLLSAVSCKEQTAIYEPGVYVGEAEGYHYKLVVTVEVDAYSILAVEVVEHKEIPILAEIVFSEIPKKVVKKNTLEVDMISGATYTSKSIMKAIKDGVEKAKLKPDGASGAEPDSHKEME